MNNGKSDKFYIGTKLLRVVQLIIYDFTDSKSHTGEYLASEILAIIETIGSKKVFGICTDNASAMKKAWGLVKEVYPNIHTYGCLGHTLHLIFTDLNKTKSIEGIRKNCTTIVKGINNSQILKALFHGQEKFCESLKLPGNTR